MFRHTHHPEFFPALEFFISVVDNGGFSAAALILNISKSAVSKRVSRLEDILGMSLLNRSTRQIALTDAGQRVYEEGVLLLKHVGSVVAGMSCLERQMQGVLKVAAPLSFGHIHLVNASAEFMRRYPDINVELLLGAAYDNIPLSSVDLAIRLGDLQDMACRSRLLMHSELTLCASPDYIQKNSSPQQPADLAEHNCLLYKGGPTGSFWHFRGPNGPEIIQPKGALVASSAQALELAALKGMGIALLPSYLLVDSIASGELVSILDSYLDFTIDVHAIYSGSVHTAPKVRSFIDFMLEYCADHCVLRRK